MEKNLMNEKLIWMTEDDFEQVRLAVCIAGNLLMQNFPPEQIFDLDGEPIDAELLRDWNQVQREAVHALCRAKWVPEDVLPKLRLILMSD